MKGRTPAPLLSVTLAVPLGATAAPGPMGSVEGSPVAGSNPWAGPDPWSASAPAGPGCPSWTVTGVLGFSNGATDTVEWSSD